MHEWLIFLLFSAFYMPALYVATNEAFRTGHAAGRESGYWDGWADREAEYYDSVCRQFVDDQCERAAGAEVASAALDDDNIDGITNFGVYGQLIHLRDDQPAR